jgi:solute carrier family 25 (mitochondrial carnitine/acylcarnitine transporter), member 20/29
MECRLFDFRVRMQTGTTGADTSVLGAMRQTLMKEGVRGLYRGVSAPLVASTPIYAISFWGYDIGQRLVRMFKTDPSQQLNLLEISAAGGFSALPTTLVMAPTERIKCLLQVQTHAAGKPQYAGMTDCALQVYRQGGISSLYKGTMLTLMRDTPGSIAWFGTYEIIKRALVDLQGIDDPSQLSPFAVMTAGGFAGMACWGVSIPPDVLKSRFQTAPDGKYNGILDVYKTLVKSEGYGALFTGFRPAMIRKLLSFAAKHRYGILIPPIRSSHPLHCVPNRRIPCECRLLFGNGGRAKSVRILGLTLIT